MNVTKLLYIFLFLGFSSTLFSQNEFKVAVVGDTPYKRSDWKILRSKFQQLEDSGYQLLIHVGDIKRGVLPCLKRRYKRIHNLLEKSTVPYLIIPGDNEYNDCYCRGPKRALKLWRKHTLNSQPDLLFNISRSNQLPENFSFIKDSVLFIGINNVGGRIHNEQEWKNRTLSNINWLKNSIYFQDHLVKSIVIFSHAAPKNDFGLYQVLQQISIKLSNPIFFIQGDIHTFSIKENWDNTRMTRLVVDNGNELSMFRTLTIKNGEIFIK